MVGRNARRGFATWLGIDAEGGMSVTESVPVSMGDRPVGDSLQSVAGR